MPRFLAGINLMNNGAMHPDRGQQRPKSRKILDLACDMLNLKCF